MHHCKVYIEQRLYAKRPLKTLAHAGIAYIAVVPNFRGRRLLTNPSVGLYCYSRRIGTGILVDNKIVLAIDKVQVAPIAVVLDKLGLAESNVYTIGTIGYGALRTSKQVAVVAQSVETIVGFCVLIVIAISYNQVGVRVHVACHGLEPSVGHGMAIRVEK